MAPAAGAFAVQSGASTVSATLLVDGFETHLGPVAGVKGAGPPAYDKHRRLDRTDDHLFFAASPSPVPELVVGATGVRNRAASAGFGVDSISATAASATSALDLAIQLYPPPPSLPFPQPFLIIHAHGVHATASYSLVVPDHVTTTGSASFTDLSIDGTLVGAQEITFSGDAAPGTVLYRSRTVTIVLDAQTTRGDVDCQDFACTTSAHGIVTHAVDIKLRNADVNGKKVSGEIVIGSAHAGD